MNDIDMSLIDVTDPKDQGYPEDYESWSDMLDGEMDIEKHLEDLFNEYFTTDSK